MTVSLDPAVAHRAKQDVAAGRAKSLSSRLNEAAKARIEGEDLQHVLDELLAETGGPPSEGELADAATRLVNADRSGTADIVDASVVVAARRYRATVVGSDRADLEVLDPDIAVLDR